MARRRRIDCEGGIHHVMNRGVDRQPVFFTDDDRLEFGRRLRHVHDQFGVETLAYCLMGNHYHLILRTPGGGLSVAMQHVSSVYTRHVNDRIGRDGPLFRGRFHSIMVTTDAYLQCAARYIHRNPLDLPGVASAHGYRWSSYRNYLGLRPNPPFVSTDLVLGLHGDDRTALAAFTENDEPSFAFDAPTEADIAQLVDVSIALDDLAHGSDDANRPWRSRTVLSLLLEAIGDDRRPAVSGLLGFPSENARRMALSRARRRARTDPSVERIVRSVLRSLGATPRAA